MPALYNEIDAYAARWIDNLITAGHVAPGIVDARSIAELTAEDLRHAGQAHFFAGIAVWSAALRAAGWPDDAPIWTGSCPCQPFSQAGRGKGTADERHLWPEWFRLIRECCPAIILGEQVASPAGLGWLDAVFTDLEGAGYACAAADLCAASVGAPHQRQRLYFVAIADGVEGRLHVQERLARRANGQAERCREAGDRTLADNTIGGRLEGGARERQPDRADGARLADDRIPCCGVADAELHDRPGRVGAAHGRASLEPNRCGHGDDLAMGDAGLLPGEEGGGEGEWLDARHLANVAELASADGATGGFWRGADYVACRDPRRGIVYRPVEPGTFPLAHGATARVGRLRAYGNAIVRPQAQAFIESVMEILATEDPSP